MIAARRPSRPATVIMPGGTGQVNLLAAPPPAAGARAGPGRARGRPVQRTGSPEGRPFNKRFTESAGAISVAPQRCVIARPSVPDRLGRAGENHFRAVSTHG